VRRSAAAAAGAGAAASAADAAADAQLQVVLWRSDVVAGVAEVDGRSLAVTRADEAVGLMFGGGAKALAKKDFRT
jgi:hypothetical protein